jgi:sugar O-acyltransferase (sialic acid O-acetyltransferase NeuD family)
VKKLLIYGAGGFGIEVLQYVRDEIKRGWPYELIGFIDDYVVAGSSVDHCPVVGSSESLYETEAEIVIALGEPDYRRRIHEWAKQRNIALATLVHSTAYVAPTAIVGEGTIVAPHAMIAAHARIGSNVVLNVYSSVGHESSLGNSTVAAPYSAVLGRTHVGCCVLLATRATILPNLKVGDFSKVSAHSLVTREVGSHCLANGNPARSREIFGSKSTTIDSIPNETRAI